MMELKSLRKIKIIGLILIILTLNISHRIYVFAQISEESPQNLEIVEAKEIILGIEEVFNDVLPKETSNIEIEQSDEVLFDEENIPKNMDSMEKVFDDILPEESNQKSEGDDEVLNNIEAVFEYTPSEFDQNQETENVEAKNLQLNTEKNQQEIDNITQSIVIPMEDANMGDAPESKIENLVVDPWIEVDVNENKLTRLIKDTGNNEVKWLMTANSDLINPLSKNTSTESETKIKSDQKLLKQDVDMIVVEILNDYLKKIVSNQKIYLKDLLPGEIKFNNKKWYIDYNQFYNGIAVYGSKISLVLTESGELLAIHSSLKPLVEVNNKISMSSEDILREISKLKNWELADFELISVNQIIFPVQEIENSKNNYLYSYRLSNEIKIQKKNPQSLWTLIMDDNSGDILLSYSDISFNDDLVESPSVYVWIQILSDIFVSDSDGLNLFPFSNIKFEYQNNVYYSDRNADFQVVGVLLEDIKDFKVTLENLFYNILDDDNSLIETVNSQNLKLIEVKEGKLILNLGEIPSQASKTVYYYLGIINDYFRDKFQFTGDKLVVHVNSHDIDGMFGGCASYYSPTENVLNFGRGGCGFLNFAFSKDVVYHEYMHYIMKSINQIPNITGSESAAINEGIADYFSASLTNDFVFGEGYIAKPRILKNQLTMSDWGASSYFNSQIFSGALWDLRMIIGQDSADLLVYNTLFAGKDTFEHFMYQMIIEDDNDENLANGTPHLNDILNSFEKHGIGPGVTGFTVIPDLATEDDPLIDTKPLFVTENPTISLTIDNLSIGFGDLSNIASMSATVTTITVDTNAADGFEVHMKSTGDGNNSGLYNITNTALIPAVASSLVVDNATAGYGMYAENASAGITIDDGFNNDGNADIAVSSIFQKVFSFVGLPDGVKSVDIRYTAVIEPITLPGIYTDMVDVMAFGNF